jgi:hypothetical protein
MDEDRVGIVMREMLSSGQRNQPPVTAEELRHRATRRTLRRVDAKVVVAVAAVAAVLVTLIVVGPLRSGNGPSHPPVANQPTTTTTTTSTTTTTTTTTPTTIPAAAASQLDSYVAAETATESAAATGIGPAQPFVSDHSPPEVDGSSVVAVAAFSYDPGGHPLQVLGYSGGHWSEVAALASPFGQFGNQVSADVIYLTQDPVSVADVTGDGRPDFLVMASAADNVPGFVVSQDGGTWRYIPFLGPNAPTPTDVLAREPQFEGNTLVSDYNNCTPDCAQGQNSTITWTYDRAAGQFRAPNPPGYITPPSIPG